RRRIDREKRIHLELARRGERDLARDLRTVRATAAPGRTRQHHAMPRNAEAPNSNSACRPTAPVGRPAYLDTATNAGTRGSSAGLRPGGSGAGPGDAAGPEAGAPVAVSRCAGRQKLV